jgi:hypothetical protein
MLKSHVSRFNLQKLTRDHDFTRDAWGTSIFPTEPRSYTESGKAVFTSSQLEWGFPEDFGWDKEYEVIEEEHSAHPLGLDYNDEVQLQRRRPVHRYCRRERFKTVLAQLMGYTGFNISKKESRYSDTKLPKKIKEILPRNIKYTPKSQMWETVRDALKENNYHIYYNRIPAILAGLSMLDYRQGRNTGKFAMIMKDFERMHEVFYEIRLGLKRKYFPSLRYVALRLMEKHGVEMPIKIPLTRTVQKRVELGSVYQTIWDYIISQESLEILRFFEEEE